MSDDLISRDTVSVDEAAHEIYKQLTEGNNIPTTPFRTMKDVFMWAVCLGVQKGQKKALAGKKVTVFRWAQFDSQIDIPLLKAIAIAESGDVHILLKRNDILILAEEYANVGIYDLQARTINDYGQPLWNLVKIVSEFKEVGL
jgi:dnd system-associated protein 4